ncbi:MAG: alpha/beta fold hydrolase [Saprospiraceae bacterium]
MRPLFSFLLLVISFTLQAQIAAPAIHVKLIGEGSPILLLPGFATPGVVFDNTVDSLDDERAYHVFTYAGFGGTQPIDTPWYPKVREALFAYVEDNELTTFDLIGHSMGGNLATEIAARFPERVNRLVLLDALPCMREMMMPGVPASAMTYNNQQTMGMYNMDPDSFEGMISGMASGMTDVPEKAKILKEWMKAADRKTYTFGYVDLLRLDLRPELSKIKALTTILAAPSFGAELVKANMEKQYANLDGAVIKVAPKGKHFLMWDAEAWYIDQLRIALSGGSTN